MANQKSEAEDFFMQLPLEGMLCVVINVFADKGIYVTGKGSANSDMEERRAVRNSIILC